MTDEERAQMRKSNPGAWLVMVLADEYRDRNIMRDGRMLSLVNELVREARLDALKPICAHVGLGE